MLARFPLGRPLAAAALAAGVAASAHAASVLAVATLGQTAPGGGVFAGPGFLGRPGAGGNGWVAFRSTIAPNGSTEELVLANMNPASTTRASIVRTGQDITPTLGKLGRFLGHPAVDPNGNVVFVVTLTPPEPAPAGEPAPAALLRYDATTRLLSVLATSGTDTPVGRLAFAEGSPSLDDRTPSVDADGDVAFTALGVADDVEVPAIFLLQNGLLTVVAAAGDTTASSTLATFGPPALNVVDHVAFRATLTGGPLTDAVFLWRDGNLTRVAANGDTVTTTEPTSHLQSLTQFGAVVDLDADDAVAFLGGPLVDFTSGSTASDFGVLKWKNDALELLAFPGQTFGARGRVTGVDLLAEFGGDVVPPRLLPGGAVFFHVELNGGSSSVLATRAGAGAGAVEIAAAGGGAPSGSPIGGTYAALTLVPTVDGTGAVVAVAELDGAPASHAMIWGVGGASSQAIVPGEPSPGPGGSLAGPSFENPALTDAGDVVFRSTVASGPSAVGLYRWSQGQMTALVRAGDPAPVDDALPFLNIVGQHDVNDDQTVVFAALVEGLGRGIYAIDRGVVVRVAVAGDLVRILSGTTASFDTLLPNPTIAPDGAIAFRARVEFQQGGATRRRDGIFVKSGTQIRAAVLEDDLAPTGESFDLFREVAVANGGAVAFVADLGNGTSTTRRGLFFADSGGVRTVLLQDDLVDGNPVTGFIGGPELNNRGTIAQLARVGGPSGDRAVLMRGTPARVGVVARVGDESPAGGVYRSLGRPAMNRDGEVAFRATFEAGSGGAPGLFTATESTVEPTVSIGDPGPASIRGQFVAFNQRVSLNGGRALAFLGSLAGGTIRDGVFLGEPTSLTIPNLRMKIGSSSKPDRLKLKIRLSSGSATRALDLASSRVRVTVQDDAGARWSEVVSSGGFDRRGRAFVYSRPPTVPKIKLKVAKNGLIRGVVRANPDLTGGGLFPIEPPITVDVEIADVSGRATVNCLVSAKRVRCR